MTKPVYEYAVLVRCRECDHGDGNPWEPIGRGRSKGTVKNWSADNNADPELAEYEFRPVRREIPAWEPLDGEPPTW